MVSDYNKFVSQKFADARATGRKTNMAEIGAEWRAMTGKAKSTKAPARRTVCRGVKPAGACLDLEGCRWSEKTNRCYGTKAAAARPARARRAPSPSRSRSPKKTGRKMTLSDQQRERRAANMRAYHLFDKVGLPRPGIQQQFVQKQQVGGYWW